MSLSSLLDYYLALDWIYQVLIDILILLLIIGIFRKLIKTVLLVLLIIILTVIVLSYLGIVEIPPELQSDMSALLTN